MEKGPSAPSISTIKTPNQKVENTVSDTKRGVGRILKAAGLGILGVGSVLMFPVLSALAAGAYIGHKTYKKN